jgi:hypothetical protein
MEELLMDIRLNSRGLCLVFAVASVFLLSAAPSAMAQIDKIDVHGFASQGYMGSSSYNYLMPTKEGSWAMSEYAVNVGTDINDDLRIGVQLFSRNLGEIGGSRVDIDWAFGDYHRYDWLGLRAGRVKVPFGLYGETADFDHVRTSVLMPQGVYDLRFRNMRTALNGINPYGNVNLKEAGGLDYTVAFGMAPVAADGSVSQFMDDTGYATLVSNENKFTLGAQVMWNTPLEGLRLGHTLTKFDTRMTLAIDPMVAGMLGIDPIQAMKFEGTVNTASVEYAYSNLLLASEYNWWDTGKGNSIGMDLAWENWYVQGSYRLNRWFEVGSYYSVHYEDKDNHEGDGYSPKSNAWQKDLALSTRFDITNNMTFKIEGHYMDGNALLMLMDNPILTQDPSNAEDNWYMIASKVSFAF